MSCIYLLQVSLPSEVWIDLMVCGVTADVTGVNMSRIESSGIRGRKDSGLCISRRSNIVGLFGSQCRAYLDLSAGLIWISVPGLFVSQWRALFGVLCSCE